MISVKILADSKAPNGVRLTTLSLRYPRFIHSELMTHRMLSRNASSSRAIPTKKILAQLKKESAMPIHWGVNQKGMQANVQLEGLPLVDCMTEWFAARDSAVAHVEKLESSGLHKQATNRLLEPFMHIDTIVSATDWDNFFNLRTGEDAQPEFIQLADNMLLSLNKSDPTEVKKGEWHLPFVTEEERATTSPDVLLMYSVSRCARVSYQTHEGKIDKARDIERYNELLKSGHMSPFEHQATPHTTRRTKSGNFRGWIQYRKTLPSPYEGKCKDLIIK